MSRIPLQPRSTACLRLFLPSLALAAVLSACNGTEPSPHAITNGLTPVPGAESKIGDFRLEGSRFILTQPRDTVWDCRDGAMVPEVDEERVDTSSIRVVGDSLIWESLPFDVRSPGVFMKAVRTLPRVGSGSGLQGVWRVTPFQYVHLSGPVTDSILERFAFDTDYQAHLSSFEIEDYILTSTELRRRIRVRAADKFLDWWNGGFRNLFPADSARYDVAIAKAAPDSLSLTGLKTGEVVGLSFGASGSRGYASSNPVRLPYMEISDRGCSSNPEITWYPAFLGENLKAGELPD